MPEALFWWLVFMAIMIPAIVFQAKWHDCHSHWAVRERLRKQLRDDTLRSLEE